MRGLRAAGQATASPDFSTAGDTMRRIADYRRLARRISPRLARACNGFRIAREPTSSPDFSTAGDTMRRIADYGRLARRISPQLGRPCHGLRAVGGATASPDFSTVGETGRLIAEGTLAGIMAINGSSVPTVSAGVGWAVTLSRACRQREPRARKVCRACRQVRLGERAPRNVHGCRQEREDEGPPARNECADCLGKCRLGGRHRSESRLDMSL
jgi:hypothetical protein